jgi:hypothetical protein
VSLLPLSLRRPLRRAAVVFALISTLTVSLVSIGPASAAVKAPPSTPTDATPHCLVRVTGRSASGELQLSTPACYATFADVLQSAGLTVADKTITPTQARDQGLIGLQRPGGGGAALDGGGIIGTHFDGANYTGSSFSVSGSDCYGGYINLTGFWANRVSSTINGCPITVHYYWPNMGGSNEALYSSGNLTWLNNLSESISYTGW